MSESVVAITRQVFRERGAKAVAVLALKKVIAPVARVGSLYFLERDLSTPMPPIKPVAGIIAREGTISDIQLFDVIEGGQKHKEEAIERLQNGELWFIAVEASTGKLANYRWATRTSGFIPELGLHLRVKPNQAYIYDLETLPEFRRRGIEAVTRQFTYESLLRKHDVNRMITYIRADNHASLQAGRQYLTAIGRVWFVCRGGRARVFMWKNDRTPELTKESANRAHAARVA